MIQILEVDGWSLKSVRGSHYKYKHPLKPGRVVVPFHGSKDVAIGTMKSILKAAKIVLSDARFEKGEE